MLLALLAVVVSPGPRAALAQSDDPRVAISVGDSTMNQGDVTWVHVSFHNMPQDPNDDKKFGVYFRYYFDRNSDGTWTNVDEDCAENLVGGDKYITTWYRTPWDHGASPFAVTTTCQVGSYRIRVSVKDKSTHTEVVSGTHDITVSLGPSVTIEMPSGPHYRGAAINPKIKFNDLVQGYDYTYTAYLMARNPSNYADKCEGTGLERNRTFTLNDVSGNPIEKTVTITADCPTNEYDIKVRLEDSDNRYRGSDAKEFEITTDPNATPSVTVSLSEPSPIAPGTEFEVIFKFYDIQPGTAVTSLDTMINTSTNQAVGQMDCGGSLVGWGVDVSGTVNYNPDVNRITIPSDCPAGSYRIVSKMKNSSGNEIISGSVDFIIGDPDLTPSAPSVSNMTAKQNSPFSQQLPVGTGGDGTLDYDASGLPPGLLFTKSTRTIAGTPTGTGTSTVRYTVTDSDGDSAYVEFTITVDPDLTPSAPSVPGYTAKQNTPFSQLLPAGSGGDGTLSYGATGLPEGLSFITTTRTIAGTPTGTGPSTVRYTVTDSDGDSAYVEFTITVNQDLEPTAPSISALSARKGSLFTRQLPEGTGGDAPLSYNAANLPTGLTFITTTRTITGTPTTVESPTVTYTVRDVDGDEASTTFQFTVAEDLMPELPSISGYTAKEDSPFSQQLPEATGGDTPLSYTATGLPTGLTFITSTRTITGTPDSEEAPTVTYTVTDSDGDSAYVEFTLTVNPNLTPSAPSVSPLTAKQNDPFSHQLPAGSGGDGSLSYNATGLPDGLLFTESTRTIAGTPTRHGPFTVRYTVTDSDGDSAYVEFTITVNQDLEPTAPSISGISARKGSLFTRQLPEGTGGDAPLSYNATNLPTGLTFITTTRTITGTPTTEQAPTVTYTVRDADGDEASTTFVFTIAADLMPTLPSISGYTARVGSPFSQLLPEATSGDPPLDYTATNLPTGLSFITSTRTIQGTPSAVESPTVTYTVRDEDGDEDSKTFSITVAADLKPSLPTISGYTGRVGSPFSKELPAATGGDSPLSYTSRQTLPAGLSFITSTRTIQGTPTEAESPTVTYTVRDEDGDVDSKTFVLTVAADLKPVLPVISGYNARVGSPFSQELPAATGGDSPLSYTAINLPTGLTFITSTRTIQGTPSTQHAPVVTYTVRDEDGDEASTTFVITVAADLKPQLPTVSAYTVKVDSSVSQVLPAATGGDQPLSYTATNLPTGLTFITSTRTIQGTPTTVESKTVTYTVRDEDGDEDIKTFLFTVAADLTPTLSTISGFTVKVNSPFSQVLPEATGGDLPLSYTATNLPTGLSFITTTRTISGTPTTVQSPTVSYTVTDDDGDEDTTTFVITVAADLTPTLPTISGYTARVGSPFSQVLPAATGGDPPLSYTASGLPSGLNFITTTRTILGTPDTVESPTVTYKVRDEDGDENSKTFTITVEADNQPSQPSIDDMHLKIRSLLRAELPEGSNGDPPYTYTISTLPSGLNFDPVTRILSGRPDSAGSNEVTYTVVDEDNDSAAVDFTINVYTLPVLPTISDTSGMKDDLFTLRLPEATGGTPPLKYSATGLPAGLQFITETRTITGTLAQVEIADVTYTVTDADLDQDSETFKITVTDLDQSQVGNNNNNNGNNGNNGGNNGIGTQSPPALTLSDTIGFTLQVGDQFTQQLPAANGGTSPYRYSVTALPPGLSFNEGAHTISGSPTSPGTTNVTYTVMDANNSQVSDDFTITVNPVPLTLPDTTGFSATVGQLFTQQLPAADGGSSPYAYGVTILPAGLTFEHSTRTITGTPAAAVTKVITYSVSDGNRNTARDTFTITVNEAQTTQPEETGDGSTPSDLQLSVGATKEFAATVGVLFTRQLPAATGGSSPYAYGVSILPAGLTFEHATRTITGTPSSAETRVVTYRVTDGELSSASDTFTITVSAGQTGQPLGPGSGNTQDPLQLSLGETKVFTATVGLQFTRQLPAASGGSSPYAYGVTTLPDGLNFMQGTRTITGTPTTAETRVVTYSVTDGTQASASDSFTITVAAGQTGPPGQPGNGGSNQGGKSPNGNPGSGNQGGGNQGGGNKGGGSNSGSKGNSGGGGSNNQPKYVPPASSHPPQQQQWSPAPVPVAITVPPWLNVRRGPGLDYEVITTVPAGTRGNIYGRDLADTWFQVQIEAASNMVWICQNLATVEGSLNGVRFLEQWEIDLIPKPADGPIATTTPAVLNVRAGPGLTYRILTTVPRGTQATIIGIGPNAEWYKVTLDALSQPAWIYAGLTTVQGLLGGVKRYTLAEVNGNTPTDVVTTDTCSANPVAITIPAVLNVRRGPGTQFEIVTTVVNGTRAEIVGIDPQEEWLLVKLDSLTEPAWIYRNLTTVVGSLAGVRRVGSEQVDQPNGVTNTVRPVAVTYPALVNIRVGPGLTYGVLKAVPQGTRASIVGLSPDENWYLVEISGLSQLGWIREDLTVLVGNLNGVKRITAAEIAMLPVAIVDTPTLNVRTGPGLGYSLVTTISKGTWVQIIGVNAQTDWLRIRLAGVSGQTWVFRDLTNLAGLLPGVTQITSSTASETSDDYPTLQATTILESASTLELSSTQQVDVSSITVELSLPQNGNIDLKVNWNDADACVQSYNIYHRSNTDSTTYFSLENAVIATTANSKSLSFLTLPDRSLISAWCGTSSNGRQVAEVQIDPGVEGTYSSLPSQPETDAVAASPGVETSN